MFTCDTDSILTNGVLPAAIVGKELGQWDLEGRCFGSQRDFIAPKQYMFKTVVKCKGIRKPVWGGMEYRQPWFSKWSTDLLSTLSERNERIEQEAKVIDVVKNLTGINTK